jgi:hypothetical protein
VALGPAPDELFHLATAGFGAQLLGWALENQVFDALEDPRRVCDLAHDLRLDSEALSEIMNTLVALRLVESRADGYRNLELASRYLRQGSPQSLRAALLYHAAQFCHWESLADFARHGNQSGFIARNTELRAQAAECLATLAAGEVVNRLPSPPDGPVLIVGWGCEAYQRAISARWPGAFVRGWNPFVGERTAPPGGEDEFAAVILSGVLEWCGKPEMRAILSQLRMKRDGLLLCHDALLAIGVQPAPQTALRVLARQVADGNVHSWSLDRLAASLEQAGFAVAESKAVLADGALVLARSASRESSTNLALAAVAAD